MPLWGGMAPRGRIGEKGRGVKRAFPGVPSRDRPLRPPLKGIKGEGRPRRPEGAFQLMKMSNQVAINTDPTVFVNQGQEPIHSIMRLKSMEIGEEYVMRNIPQELIESKRNFIHVTGFYSKPRRKFVTRKIGNDLYYKRVS